MNKQITVESLAVKAAGKMKDVNKVVIGRNGLVSFWCVFSQTWETRDVVATSQNADVMASLPESQRVRIRRAAKFD